MGRGEIIKAEVRCKEDDGFIQVKYDETYRYIFPGDDLGIRFEIYLRNEKILIGNAYDAGIKVKMGYYDCMDKEYKIGIPIDIKNYKVMNSDGKESGKLILQSENLWNCNIGNIIRLDYISVFW